MRLRTIEQTAAYLKETDHDTALTKNAIRTMVKDGTIPSVRAGNKYLIDLDRLGDILGEKMNIIA